MNILDAILLGIIQGLTEFLPVSSTAHLTIVGKLLGIVQSGELWTAQIAVMQLGTLAAILIYFRNDVFGISASFLKENLTRNRLPAIQQSMNAKMGWFILFGSIPIVTIGLALKKIIEGDITKSLFLIGIMLILIALCMGYAEKKASFERSIQDIKLKDAFLIGLAQALALIPGSSRSGTTITAGLFLGLNREAAARFSFLLSIPAVLGSGILELKKAIPIVSGEDFSSLMIATIISGISGYAAIAFLLNYLRSKSIGIFIYYRLALGCLLLFLAVSGILS
jgi:undecaprenyl-diphosphatase